MIEINILKCLINDKTLYEKYYKYLRIDDFVKVNYPLLNKLFKCLPVSSLSALETAYLTNYPVLKDGDRAAINSLLEQVDAAECDTDAILAYVEGHRARAIASDMALLALDVSEGRRPLAELISLSSKLDTVVIEEEFEDEVCTDIEVLMNEEVLTGGLHWRLKCLNQSLGPLRLGNFGHVFARVETGKTAFWISEVVHMAQQLAPDETVLIFFNEEQGQDVIFRMYSALTGMSYMDLRNNLKVAKHQWDLKIGNRIKFFDKPSQVSKHTMERLLEKYKPKLCIVDNADKVKGFSGDREDMRLHEIYKWLRELAKVYCPIISIGQADATGKNSMYLDESQMANSKTAKPSELDFVIGIGRIDKEGYDNVRYIFVSKNKLRGDANTMEGLRHIKCEVLLTPAISVYSDR